MGARGFRRSFTPLSGCFSPFPHGTRPLSVIGECSALEGGPPCFPPGFTCPAVLGDRGSRGGASRTGLSPAAAGLSMPFRSHLPLSLDGGSGAPTAPGPATPAPQRRQAMRVRRFGLGPLSLAATRGISVDFSSSGYLDVSVPRVAPVRPRRSGGGARAWPLAGSPIRRSPDRGPCAPPRGLSQLAASFVDFRCQGIRLAPLVSSSRGPRLGPASAIRVLLLKLHLSLHGCFFVPPGPARRPGGPDVKSRYRETQTHRRPAAAAAGP